MTDYFHGIGGPSTMMIRDTGGWVEFWFQTGSQTWNNDQWWSYSANGAFSRQKFRLLRGGAWQHFGSVYVSYDQDVQFTIEGTGLGWPTSTFTQHIQRSTVPAPPTMLAVYPISSSQIHVVFAGSYDGGSPVVEWQIGYGSSAGGPTAFVGSGGTSDIGGFLSGQRIYFWARGRNAVGWSGWSNRGEAVTWTAPQAPGPPTITDKNQTSMRVQYNYVVDTNNPATLERQLGYGLSPVAPTDFANDPSGSNLVSDLIPGGTYYVWGRSRNSVDWGPWSEATQVLLIAGARILVGSEWKRAVPYVRAGGVWKVAEPWIKAAGTWKKTSV
jgi:hypothetical protein